MPLLCLFLIFRRYLRVAECRERAKCVCASRVHLVVQKGLKSLGGDCVDLKDTKRCAKCVFWYEKIDDPLWVHIEA